MAPMWVNSTRDTKTTIPLQSKPLRADQKEQLPGLQPESDQEIRQLPSQMSSASAKGEHHPL